MKKLILVLFLLFSIVTAFADTEKILEVVNEELSETYRLSKQLQHKNPDLTLRLAELTLEKARLTKQMELHSYLALAPEKRSEKVKQDYFKKSNELYKSATSICVSTVKKFPKYKNYAEVLYIIAQNYIEQKEINKAKKYLEDAIHAAKPGTTLYARTRLSLAEIEYNNRSYDKAYKLYQTAFADPKAREDKWWTKDAALMAWTAYKLDKSSAAIKTMEEVLEKSQSGKYIDVTKSTKRDLALFYADIGQTDKSLELLGNDTGALIKLSEYLRTKGKNDSAAKILKNVETSESSDNYSLLSLLESYQANENYERHLKISERLLQLDKDGKLNKDEREILQSQLQVAGSNLQRKNKPELVEKYFTMLASYKSKPQGKLNLLIGESYAKSKKPVQAHVFYNKAFSFALEAKDAAAMQQALDLIFISLAAKEYKSETKDNDLKEAYNKAITYFPKAEKTRKIYEKNFRIALDSKNPEEAEKVIHTFNSTWPNEKITTEAMIAELVDNYIKNKNMEGAQKWFKLITEDQNYKIGLRVTAQIRKKILAIRIDDRANSTDPNKNLEALKAYAELYNVDSATHLEKFEAALNISIMLHKLSKAKHLAKWSEKALSHARIEDLEKKINEFLNFSILLYDMQFFNEAESLSKSVSIKLCKSKTEKKEHFFKNAFNLALINYHFDEALEALERGQKCGLTTKLANELRKSFFDSLVINQQWKSLEKFLPKFEKEDYLLSDSIWYHEILLKKLSTNENESIKKQLELFNLGKKKKITLSIESLDAIAGHQFSKVEEMVQANQKINLSFPEKVFNTHLETKFKNLQNIIEAVVKLRPLGTPKSVLYGYRVIIKSIIDLKIQIQTFRPEGVSESFFASFSKSMHEFVKQLDEQKTNYANEATRIINKDKLLSEDALWLKQIAKQDFPIQYFYSKEPMLMDRQGGNK